MAYSINKCRQLQGRINKLETSLDNYLNGERVSSIQDGPELVNFQAGSSIPRELRNRIEELKRDYANGTCAVVLGCDDIAPPSRRALRPGIGHS